MSCECCIKAESRSIKRFLCALRWGNWKRKEPVQAFTKWNSQSYHPLPGTAPRSTGSCNSSQTHPPAPRTKTSHWQGPPWVILRFGWGREIWEWLLQEGLVQCIVNWTGEQLCLYHSQVIFLVRDVPCPHNIVPSQVKELFLCTVRSIPGHITVSLSYPEEWVCFDSVKGLESRYTTENPF